MLKYGSIFQILMAVLHYLLKIYKLRLIERHRCVCPVTLYESVIGIFKVTRVTCDNFIINAYMHKLRTDWKIIHQILLNCLIQVVILLNYTNMTVLSR
jgi:hypothetical protein